MTTALAATIVHPATADALAAYLDTSDAPVSTVRMQEYIVLMYYRMSAAVDLALWALKRAGRIEHVAVGVWRGRGVG